VTRRHDGTLPVNRREFFALGALGLLGVSGNVPSWRRIAPQAQDSLPGTGPSASCGIRLAPAGPRARRAADNDAAIQAIEKQIHCTCGCNLDVYTCRTTDFTCVRAGDASARGRARRASKSAQQILDAFVQQNGVAILMAPPKRGFNLAGYFVRRCSSWPPPSS